MDGPFLPDSFTVLGDAQAIAETLFVEPGCPFNFARDGRIAYVLQQPRLMLRGESADAYIAQAKVQGSNRLLWEFLAARFARPDRQALEFIVYIDAVAWQLRATHSPELGRASGFPIQQEALVFHELCHLRHSHTSDGEPRYHEDGRALLALQRHTYEFFASELRRYGPQTSGLEQVGVDYVIGAKEEKTRRRSKLRIA